MSMSDKPVDLKAILARVHGAPADLKTILDTIKPAPQTLDFDPERPTTGVGQRWRGRRDFYRSNEDRFSVDDWRVDAMVGKTRTRTRFPSGYGVLDSFQDGKDFIIQNHYVATHPQIRVMVGLFRARDAKLCGVATFSNVKKSQLARYGGLGSDELVELSRFVLLDEVPGNAESWFLARSTEVARELEGYRHGGIKALLSFSDPVPRRAISGRLTMPGHIGNIYQAHNALYLGYSKPKTLHLDARGVAPDPRMLSKVRSLDKSNPEAGGAAAFDRLIASGAPGRGRGESYASWLSRVLDSHLYRKFSHNGNLTYLWVLGDRRVRRQVKAALPPERPYPKTPRQRYLNAIRKFERYMAQGNVDKAAGVSGSVIKAWGALSEDDRAHSPQPPQALVACPAGSRNQVWGMSAEQVVQRAVCSV